MKTISPPLFDDNFPLPRPKHGVHATRSSCAPNHLCTSDLRQQPWDKLEGLWLAKVQHSDLKVNEFLLESSQGMNSHNLRIATAFKLNSRYTIYRHDL